MKPEIIFNVGWVLDGNVLREKPPEEEIYLFLKSQGINNQIGCGVIVNNSLFTEKKRSARVFRTRDDKRCNTCIVEW